MPCNCQIRPNLPPKNLSSSFPSTQVWWSARLSSSIDALDTPLPNLGAQPVLSTHLSLSSSSMNWPLTPFVIGFPDLSFGGAVGARAPAVEGGGRSYAPGFPSSISVGIATPFDLCSWWNPSGIRCRTQ